jgi:hypothetical protein
MSFYTPGSTGVSIPQNPNGMLCYKAPDHCDQLVVSGASGKRNYVNATGTLTGGTVTIPAGATSVELVLHSTGATVGGGIASTGPFTGLFTWPGTRGWESEDGNMTATDWTFSAMTPTTVFEVLWSM